MSHELEEHDHMAFVGQVPWHGLGTNLGDEHVSSDTIIEAAKLDWRVSAYRAAVMLSVEEAQALGHLPILNGPEVDAMRRACDENIERLHIPDEIGTLITVPGERRLIREDTLDVFASVGNKYTVLQNKEVAAFLDSLMEAAEGELRYEVAGSLNNGRRVWFVAKLGDGLHITRADGSIDEVSKYLLALNYHDGRGSFKVLGTGIRGVCNNTITAALATASNVYALRHVGNLEERLKECREAIRLEREYFVEYADQMSALDKIQFTKKDTRDFAASALAGEQAIKDAEEVIVSVKSDRTRDRLVHDVDMVEALSRDGEGNRGESAYDAFQGLTAFLDHHKERMKRARDVIAKAENRMSDILLGDAAKVRKRAVRMLTRSD
jgi:phage/plasmid-like protein (TIGR03299 family)